ncbi:MAG: asparagine synthase-related protein [Myxococcota bacterium]
MTDLVGAWSLTQTSVGEALPRRQREAMRRQLCGATQREVLTRRMWLLAAPSKVAERPPRVSAWEGFVADGRGESIVAGRGAVGRPEGHYVLAESDGTTLTLVRSLSGGERLYVAKVGDLVLFSASLRPLLAHEGITRRLDPAVTDEVLLTGHPVFGAQSPIVGVQEVLPGHRATVDADGSLRQQWHWPDAVVSPRGTPEACAKRFREALRVAVERAAGPKRPVAIALSGGIDSSAVAAAAVEVLGADGVHAFTYEFDDPTHVPPETRHATAVAKALGIRRHDVFKVGLDEFLTAVPEHVWRSESAVHWPKAFLLPVARTIASHGYDRYLTGFGIGSHMGYLSELARALPWIPRPKQTLKLWRRVRFEAWDWAMHLAKLHPGLEPPHPRLYDLLLQLLERRGVIDDLTAFYPPEMRPLLERRRGRSAALPDFGGEQGELGRALQRHAFAHLVSCIDVTRSEKASREVGVYRVAPAHFAGCIPYAYFPVDPPPFVWSRARHQRPGKRLLQIAYRGVLPDEILFRKKSWDDAVTSRAWRKRGRVFMLRALPRFPADMDALGPHHPGAIESWEATSIQANCLSFWFWNELFVRRSPGRSAPSWSELWGYTAEQLASTKR